MVDIGSVLFHLDETVLVRVGLGETLLLRSTILKPDLGEGRTVLKSVPVRRQGYLHLGLGERQRGRELGTFGNGQVLLVTEFLLERQQLSRAERRAWLAVLFVFA